MKIDHLLQAITDTAHSIAGLPDSTNQVVCDALRGVVARAKRYEASDPDGTYPGPVMAEFVAQQNETELLPPVEPVSRVIDKPETPCMTPQCGRVGLWKGLCRSCYGQALRLIEQKQTTWDNLTAMGLADGASKPFMAAFEKAKLNPTFAE